MLRSLTRIMLAVLLLPALARAATFTVNTTADAVDAVPGDGNCATSTGTCSLRAAVQEANAHAGADAIALPGGLFRLTLVGAGEDAAATGDLDVTDALTVSGAGADATIVDGVGSDRVFHVVGGGGMAVGSLTIRNGDAAGGNGGGIWVAPVGAPLTLNNVTFDGNHAGTGGAVWSNGPLAIQGCTFGDQVASGDGGGVAAFGSSAVTIASSRFTSNVATGSGGGVRVLTSANVTVTDTSFSGNFANGTGGGLAVQTNGDLGITGGDFTDNTGLGGAGGAAFNGQATSVLFVQGTAFRGNRTLGAGGGLYSQAGGAATLANVEASGNRASIAGGAYLSGQNGLTVASCRFLDDTTTSGPGGGLFDNGANDTIVTNSLFADNVTANAPGGGFYRAGGGGLQLQASTLARNVAGGPSGLGGGLFVQSASASSLVDTTFSGNVADMRGGALYPGSQVTIVSSTLVGNEAIDAGGAVYSPGPLVTFTNSIIAGSSVQPACSGAVTSSGGNIDGDGSCALASLGDRSHLDPMLGPLADNGGPTPTHALVPGSPAIDAANSIACPAVDQRGVPRVSDGNGDGVGGCDIGAFEYVDQCPNDPAKTVPGVCGCGVPDVDANGNGVVDCLIDAELKARLATARTLVNGLTGKKDAGATTAIDALAQGIVDYVGGLRAQIHVTDAKANLDRLTANLRRTARKVGRARGRALNGARKRALAAIDALDAVVAAD